MNKKGFTLTELILTIGLLAVIGLVIVTNMSGLLEKNKEKAKKFIHISLPIIELIILIVIAWYFINKKW